MLLKEPMTSEWQRGAFLRSVAAQSGGDKRLTKPPAVWGGSPCWVRGLHT